MTRSEFCSSFWRYYSLIEQDFVNTESFLEPDLGDNYLYSVEQNSTFVVGNSLSYSLNYLKLLNVICAEFDSVCRSIAKEILNRCAKNMSDFAKSILEIWPDIPTQRVVYYGKKLIPFAGWTANDKCTSPEWWHAYTNCKHGRVNNFIKANLKNVVNSLAALYMLEYYYIKFLGDRENTYDVPNSPSNIFELENFKTKHIVVGKDSYTYTNEGWLDECRVRGWLNESCARGVVEDE